MTQHVRKGKVALQERREKALAGCAARVDKYQALLNEAAEEDATLDEAAAGYVPNDLEAAIDAAQVEMANLNNKNVFS
jgi:hypothetical protein